MKESGKRQNIKIKKLFQWGIGFGVFSIIGIGVGFMIGEYADRILPSDAGIGQYLFMVGSLLVGMYVSLFLHIVIHESGHLICGYISGYQFYSFRIGSNLITYSVQKGGQA